MQRRFCKAAVASAAFLFATVASAVAAPNPISIQQCFVSQPKLMSHTAGGTQIDYTNNGKYTATQVTFAVGYRNAASHFVRRVVDYGSFAPGAAIQHHFDLYNDVTYSGKQTDFCYATKVVFANGNVWVAP
jgi:hypothetical protein